MPLSLSDLDLRVRAAMAAKLDDDIARGGPYISPRLNPPGVEAWPELLRAAIEPGDDGTLAASLHGLLNDTESRIPSRGKLFVARVPHNASETLAEGEFNRYYVRGLAVVALEEGVTELEVYRAKAVTTPRFESDRLVGRRLSPNRLLADLRASPGVDTALGVPAGPNSGLSVRVPLDANRDTA